MKKALIIFTVLLLSGCSGLIGIQTGDKNTDLLWELTRNFVNDDKDCDIKDPEARYNCYQKLNPDYPLKQSPKPQKDFE